MESKTAFFVFLFFSFKFPLVILMQVSQELKSDKCYFSVFCSVFCQSEFPPELGLYSFIIT